MHLNSQPESWRTWSQQQHTPQPQRAWMHGHTWATPQKKWVPIFFMIRLAFEMTITKSQAQSLWWCGVWLTPSVFTHRRPFAATSRVGDPFDLRISLPTRINSVKERDGTWYQNAILQCCLSQDRVDKSFFFFLFVYNHNTILKLWQMGIKLKNFATWKNIRCWKTSLCQCEPAWTRKYIEILNFVP